VSHSTRLAVAVKEYRAGKSVREAALASGLSRTEVYKHLRFSNQIRKQKVMPQKRYPDEETIRQRAEEIKASWSPEERARRYVGGNGGSRRVEILFERIKQVCRRGAA
jgi:transposase